MDEKRLQEIEARRKAAWNEMVELNNGWRRWTMCVPMEESDSDIVFAAALNDIPDLTAALRAAEERARVAEERAQSALHLIIALAEDVKREYKQYGGYSVQAQLEQTQGIIRLVYDALTGEPTE